MTSVSSFVNAISTTIVNPLLALLFALGLLLFLAGIVEFLAGLNKGDNAAREKGKQHMIWGLIGMFIMMAAVSILHVIISLVCQGSGSWNGCVYGPQGPGGGPPGTGPGGGPPS